MSRKRSQKYTIPIEQIRDLREPMSAVPVDPYGFQTPHNTSVRN